MKRGRFEESQIPCVGFGETEQLTVRANVLMEKVEVKQGPFYTQFEVWFSLEADIASCHELDDSVICSGQRFPLKGGQSHAFPRCGMISNQLA